MVVGERAPLLRSERRARRDHAGRQRAGQLRHPPTHQPRPRRCARRAPGDMQLAPDRRGAMAVRAAGAVDTIGRARGGLAGHQATVARAMTRPRRTCNDQATSAVRAGRANLTWVSGNVAPWLAQPDPPVPDWT